MSTLGLILSAITGASIVTFLVSLVIIGLIFWLFVWFLEWAGIPEPFNKVARVAIGLAALIFLVNALLTLVGKGFINW